MTNQLTSHTIAARVVCVILHRGLCKQFGIKRIRPPSRSSPAPKKHSTKAAQINQPARGEGPLVFNMLSVLTLVQVLWHLILLNTSQAEK